MTAKSEYMIAYRQKNKDKLRTYQREYNNTHKEERKARDSKRKQDNPEEWQLRERTTQIKKRYGITIDTYDEMLEEQQGCCKICGIHERELNKRLHVDHSHITGEVRGLLCTQCNTGIGMLQDSPEIIDAAAAYLRSYIGV